MATNQTPKIANGITQDMLVSVCEPIGTGEKSEVFAGTLAYLSAALSHGGGGGLITWIETVNRNGYNASNVGFKTKTAYRGTSIGGTYERAETILSFLNDL